MSAEANQTGKSGAVATRPADQDAGFPAKKRKRRRRSRGGAQDGAQHSSQSQQPQASAAPDQRAADEHGHASSNKSGKNRRKHRSKRGLQGRPLAHEKTAQLVAPAAVIAAERAPAHNDHRLQPQQRREGSASHQQADPDSRPWISMRRSISAPTIAVC